MILVKSSRGVLSLFVLFVFSMIFMWIGVVFVSQNIQYSSALRFHNNAICQLENTRIDSRMISKLVESARQNGYTLLIKQFEEGNDINALVELSYKYRFPIINKTNEYCLKGFAR